MCHRLRLIRLPHRAPALIRILPLADIAPEAVERLLDAAFGADRHGRTAYRLRKGMAAIPRLSFAACDGGGLVGTIQCWPIALTDGSGAAYPLILVGPVAVDPPRQRDGIGRMLMTRMLAAAEQDAAREPLVLIGDPEYYGRFFGFDAAATGGWRLPGPFEPRRLLARAIAGQRLPAEGMLGPRV